MITDGKWKFNVREITTVPGVAGWITVDGIRIMTVLFGDGIDLNDAIDDAYYTCTACNSHADLLAACKLIQAALTEYNLRDIKKRYSLCVADSAAGKAIAKAENN